jgi:hypothetical protein
MTEKWELESSKNIVCVQEISGSVRVETTDAGMSCSMCININRAPAVVLQGDSAGTYLHVCQSLLPESLS